MYPGRHLEESVTEVEWERKGTTDVEWGTKRHYGIVT